MNIAEEASLDTVQDRETFPPIGEEDKLPGRWAQSKASCRTRYYQITSDAGADAAYTLSMPGGAKCALRAPHLEVDGSLVFGMNCGLPTNMRPPLALVYYEPGGISLLYASSHPDGRYRYVPLCFCGVRQRPEFYLDPTEPDIDAPPTSCSR